MSGALSGAFTYAILKKKSPNKIPIFTCLWDQQFKAWGS